MPTNKQKDISDNSVYNFYDNAEVQKLTPKYENPNFHIHGIDLPFRACIVAPSGTGKTQFVLNLIAKMNETFGHITVCYKASEPLYEFLANKIGGENITFYTSLAKLPQPNDIEHKNVQQLIIFDDLVNESEKAQAVIKEYFLRARKIGKGISLCYLSQSFFKIPKFIRNQYSLLIILKLSSDRDLNLILSDFGLGVDKAVLLKIYKDATREKFNFLKVDLNTSNINRRFCKNWNSYFRVEDIDPNDKTNEPSEFKMF